MGHNGIKTLHSEEVGGINKRAAIEFQLRMGLTLGKLARKVFRMNL